MAAHDLIDHFHPPVPLGFVGESHRNQIIDRIKLFDKDNTI
jgi:hypothetical protein